MSVAASSSVSPTPVAGTALPSTARKSSNYSPGPNSLNEVAGGATLSRGQSGPAVLDLQRKLNAAGMQPPLAEDGLFGPKTKAAVRAFQRSNSVNPSLSPDGILAPRPCRRWHRAGASQKSRCTRGIPAAPRTSMIMATNRAAL